MGTGLKLRTRIIGEKKMLSFPPGCTKTDDALNTEKIKPAGRSHHHLVTRKNKPWLAGYAWGCARG